MELVSYKVGEVNYLMIKIWTCRYKEDWKLCSFIRLTQ